MGAVGLKLKEFARIHLEGLLAHRYLELPRDDKHVLIGIAFMGFAGLGGAHA